MTGTDYKILAAEEWRAALAEGHYEGSAVDLARFGADLVWEPSRGGDLFPHLYAPLPVAAVTAVRALSVAEDGAMLFEDPA